MIHGIRARTSGNGQSFRSSRMDPNSAANRVLTTQRIEHFAYADHMTTTRVVQTTAPIHGGVAQAPQVRVIKQASDASLQSKLQSQPGAANHVDIAA